MLEYKNYNAFTFSKLLKVVFNYHLSRKLPVD